MDSQRNLLIIFLLFVSFIIWQTWQTDQSLKNSTQSGSKLQEKKVAMLNKQMLPGGKGKLISVKTDVLLLKINSRGGDIEEAFLLSYPDRLGSPEPFHLLENSSKFVYQAQSGLVGENGPDNPINGQRPIYCSEKDTFTLEDNQEKLQVPMRYVSPNGIIYDKVFTLRRGAFSVDVDYYIYNSKSHPIEVTLFGQLKQSVNFTKSRDNSASRKRFGLNTYRGVAYSSFDKKYQKYSLKSIINKDLFIKTQGGWVAMLQEYFATAWIPPSSGENVLYTRNLENNQVAVGFKTSPISVKAHDQRKLGATLWLGPEIQDKMAVVAPNLDLVVDYGWLWFISQPLFKLLKWIHNYIDNWGFSIVAITFIVRGLMYPLTKAQYTAMAKMRLLQPKIAEMRKRLGDDKQRQSQEILALYKKERVNPLGGCLPLVIQMPIFLALYYMLSGSIELRHARFVLWIHDLSAQDPFYILPMLMGATMFLIQKTSNTTTADPTHQKIMTYTPVIFVLFFLWLPSGLVLYYTVSNLMTIIQQKFIYRSLKKQGLYGR